MQGLDPPDWDNAARICAQYKLKSFLQLGKLHNRYWWSLIGLSRGGFGFGLKNVERRSIHLVEGRYFKPLEAFLIDGPYNGRYKPKHSSLLRKGCIWFIIVSYDAWLVQYHAKGFARYALNHNSHWYAPSTHGPHSWAKLREAKRKLSLLPQMCSTLEMPPIDVLEHVLYLRVFPYAVLHMSSTPH